MNTSSASPAVVPGFEARVVDIGETRLACRIGGDRHGPPVVLWHGFLGTGWTWRKVAPLLAQRGYAVLVPDMRGYGDSDKPGGTQGYDGRALAADFRALVAALNFGSGRPLTLVAHDMGAAAALLWAADHPKEVAALVYLDEPVLLPDVLAKLISFTPEATKLGGLWWWMMALGPGMAELLLAGHERAFLRWNYDNYAADAAAIEPEAVAEVSRSFAAEGGVAGAFGVYRAVPETVAQTAPLAEAKVDTPILALGGEASLGGRVAEMLAAVCERVEGDAVKGCGHFIPEERPQELVARIDSFVAARRT